MGGISWRLSLCLGGVGALERRSVLGHVFPRGAKYDVGPEGVGVCESPGIGSELCLCLFGGGPFLLD